jgi:serine/threonine protein phosphatase PrpC
MGKAFQWSSQSFTHVGTVRKVNEDSYLERPDLGLWVVADGMGGHSAGDVASRKIVESLGAVPQVDSLAELLDDVENRLEQVNADLIHLAKETRKKTIGSTVVALVIRGGFAVAAWTGDSRLYRHRAGKLAQLTQDHAFVEELVEVGLLSRAEAEKHPQANRITRAIGAAEQLFVDFEIFALKSGDRFLLCSDGLYKEVSDADIGATLAADGNPAQKAVELALSRGARDNVTVVTVEIQ